MGEDCLVVGCDDGDDGIDEIVEKREDSMGFPNEHYTFTLFSKFSQFSQNRFSNKSTVTYNLQCIPLYYLYTIEALYISKHPYKLARYLNFLKLKDFNR